MRSTLKLKSQLLPFIVAGLLLLQIASPAKVWKLLLVGFGGLWLFAYLYVSRLATHLSLVREMRYGWVQVGDILEERFTLKNTDWLPAPWVEIEDRSTLPGYNASVATGVDASSTTRWNKKGTCSQRGFYQLGGTTLHTGDPFGIYELSLTDTAHHSVLVMPPVIPLPVLDIAVGGYDGEGRAARHASQNTLDASTVRKYVSGDSTKLIHWKTTARMQQPYVRLFDGAPSSVWWILLDLQDDVQVGVGEDSTEENGIILAASLVDHGLRTHKQVGLLVNGQNSDQISPQAGLGHGWKILGALALASRANTSLATMLGNLGHSVRQGSTLVIISPTTSTDWLEQIPALQRRGITLTVFLLDPESFDGDEKNSFLRAQLKKMGITYYQIPRTLFDRPEVRPGTEGQWEWRVSATGRAIPVQKPSDQNWRRLTR